VALKSALLGDALIFVNLYYCAILLEWFLECSGDCFGIDVSKGLFGCGSSE